MQMCGHHYYKPLFWLDCHQEANNFDEQLTIFIWRRWSKAVEIPGDWDGA